MNWKRTGGFAVFLAVFAVAAFGVNLHVDDQETGVETVSTPGTAACFDQEALQQRYVYSEAAMQAGQCLAPRGELYS